MVKALDSESGEYQQKGVPTYMKTFCAIWYRLYNLKREKHPWKSVTFSKVAGFCLQLYTKINNPPWVLFTFLKLYKWYQIT